MTFPSEMKASFGKILTKNKISFSYGWGNYMGTVRNPGAMVIAVDSEEELQFVIKKIKEMNADRNPDNKITARATAGWTDKNTANCCLFPWSQVQENEYNEGFSFSQVVGGRASDNTPGTDIIIRFGKKFHHMQVMGPLNNPTVYNSNNPIHKLPSTLVEVSAGVQIAELADFLRKKDLSLTTVSMISWVTAVGLSGTAGHGTGRDEPAFSGLIESFKICDMDGTIREITKENPDFAALAGGHSGLLGVVLSIKMRAVQAFNLRETIELFPNAKAMAGKLDDILKNNQYASIMGMPSFVSPEIDKLVSKWQIRKWNYSTEKPTKNNKPTYAPDSVSFNQELEMTLGAPIMEFLMEPGLTHLLPYYSLLAATSVTGARGTKPIVDFENNITHPQVAFPKAMRDVSYLFPVKDASAGKTLETVLQTLDELLEAAENKDEFPVTYAIYVRYIKGTNGGLSTSATSADDERVIAMDIVTHPGAPGIASFERNFMTRLKELGITPRHHLGKNFPAGVEHYDQFLGAKAVSDSKDALERWYCTSKDKNDGADRLAMSPFYTPYLQSMLSPSPLLTEKLVIEKELVKPKEQPAKQHSDTECVAFLSLLQAQVSLMQVHSDDGKVVKSALLDACKQELDARNQKLKGPSLV